EGGGRREADAERAQQQRAAERTGDPAREQVHAGDARAPAPARRRVRGDVAGDAAQVSASTQERQPNEVCAREQEDAAANAESDDDQQRPAEISRAGRGGG